MVCLETKNYSFLDSVKTERYEQVLQLGNEAPFYVALHFMSAGRLIEARKMLEVGIRKSPEPYKSLCIKEMIRIGTPEERLEAVELYFAQTKELDIKEKEKYEKFRVDLLLELGRSDTVPSGVPVWFYTHEITEQLVSSFASLPTDYPSNFYPITACRINVFRKAYQIAWTQAKPLLENGTKESLYREVLSDFGKAAVYGSVDVSADAVFWNDLASKTDSPDANYLIAFYTGRLYAREATQETGVLAASTAEKARAHFERAMKKAQTDEDFDSALWYLLDVSRKISTEKFLNDIEKFSPEWKNPEWYTDILDSFIVELMQKRDWKSLVRFHRVLPVTAEPEIRTQLDYLATRSGLLSEKEAKAAYERSFTEDHGLLYYRVLSAEALDIPIGSAEGILYKLKKNANPSLSDAAAAGVLRGFIKYKLPNKLYAFAVKLYPAIPVPLATELASMLTEANRPSDALRIMMLSLRSTDTPITDEDLKHVYPRPYLAEVSAAAARFNIPEYLLYALIRSESYFQSDVISGAGAIGLTQLMSPTAGDIARKLKVTNFNLADPATNITFGAYYLSELLGRLDGRVMPSLFAYNAGITTVRRWQKTGSAQPDDLFLETLPYAETREYGRKVLASAAVYGYLYYQKTTSQVVREIF